MVHWVLALGLGVEFTGVVLGKEGLPEGPVAADDERQGRGLVEGVHRIGLAEDCGIEANMGIVKEREAIGYGSSIRERQVNIQGPSGHLPCFLMIGHLWRRNNGEKKTKQIVEMDGQ